MPNGGEIFYAYDLDGNCIAQTDAEGNKTEFIYDERNRLIKTISPTGAVTAYEYNQEGRLSCIKNAVGQSHTYDYDAMGQLIRETSVSGNSTSYEYNVMGKVSAVIDAGKRRTEYEYYPGGQLEKIIFPDGRSERFIYNKNGRLLRRQNHNGTTLEYSYDRLNRLVLVRSNLGQEKSYTYDAVGNVTSIKDALGHRTQYVYSKGGKLISVSDAEENQVEYSYDAMGRLAAVCQHDKAHGTSRTTQYERDLMGNILCAVNPLGLKEYYGYDKMGRLVRKTDRDGYETQYSYNGEGDLESILYGDGRRAEFSYHPLRKLQEVKDWLGSIRVEWDDAGRMKKIQNQRGEEICYTWGALGERKACLYPDGRKVSYEYDELGRLSRLSEGIREVLYQYDQEGRLCKKQYPQGLTSTYDYNALGLLSRLTYQQQGEVLEQYAYEYDQIGNKTSIRKNRNFQMQSAKDNGLYQYQYDALNRLVGVRKDRRLLRRYAYDAFGNRILKEDEGSSIHYYYNAADQMVSLKGAGRTEEREYDGRGNLTAVVRGQKVINRYHYGADNRLEEAICADGRKAHYRYDGLGNRVGVEEYQKDESEKPVKTVEYLLDITRQYRNLLTKTEITAETTSSQSFVWDNDILFAEDSGNVGFYLQDELGSTVRFLDSQNKEETIYGYDEFGQDLYGTQGQKQPFGYTGYQKDSIAGTYFAQAREYLADVGRFTASDKYGWKTAYPKTMNRYHYCWNSPLKFVDLDGLFPMPPMERTILPPQGDRAMPSDARINPRYEGKTSWKEYGKNGQYDEMIRANRQYILHASSIYEIDPQTLAACIYVEQSRNVDNKDYYLDWTAGALGLDTSLGIGQVKISSAQLVEDEGYIQFDAEDYPGFIDTGIMSRLADDEINIMYAAAYLKYQQDQWIDVAPQVTEPEILGTLYNLGHEERGKGILGYVFGIGNTPRIVHSNPQGNDFGAAVKSNYQRMGDLLGISCEGVQ